MFSQQINRKNLRHTYHSCIGFFFAGLILMLTALIFDFPLEASVYGTVFFLLTALYAAALGYLSYYALRKKLFSCYAFITWLFWGSMLCCLLAFSLLCQDPIRSICASFLVLLPFSLLITAPNAYLLILIILLGLGCATCILLRFEPVHIIALIVVNVLPALLSRRCFYSFKKRLRSRRQADSIKTDAELDPLTSLLSYNGLLKRINDILPFVLKDSEAALLMIRVDGFPRYSRSFGQAAGDECILSVTEKIRSAVSGISSLAARTGYGTFVLFITGFDGSDALLLASDLKLAVESMKLSYPENTPIPYVTVSIGITCGILDIEKGFMAFMEEADKALFHAQSNGNACISFNGRCYSKILIFDEGTKS